MKLDGRVAVITGGASGIGLETARRFVAEGARVVLGDLNKAMLEDAAAELGASCAIEQVDVTVEDDVARLVARAADDFGGVDIGVNCAGLGAIGPITTLAVEQWDLVVDVCLKGVFLATKHEAAAMQAAGRPGVIINIASINARQPGQGMSAYCAAKAGVEMFTRVAAMELGPSQIRVVGIGPGLIDTPLTQYQRDMPMFRDGYLENIPMGRVGATADIATAAVFLASDDASWISGDTLFVDGASLTRGYPQMLDILGRAMQG
ncbi:MAG: glucose 1-dehydrogenase [Actinomycetota bacterium]|jgi:NAD(P)-dependent dehydrogenase (short-subunit alcohol dehydrogenase family)|nr:glucose 1-dehydrogenase [Actinomycetota bacterium]